MIGTMTALTSARRRLGWAGLLAPAAALYLTIFGVHPATVAAVAIALAASLAMPVIAADLVPLALIYLGLHWLVYALVASPSSTRQNYVVSIFRAAAHASAGGSALTPATSHPTLGMLLAPVTYYVSTPHPAGSHWTALAGVQVTGGAALLLFGVWLIPATIGLHARVMRRNGELASRVSRLTETRVDAVDAAAAELRRVERNLHDGTQARLVALGISLRVTEHLISSDPAAAIAMVADARENSARALADLRSLVRGINPPVLAERGLGDAVKALALDTPMPVTVDIDLVDRPPAPVAAAVYFSVAEALANAAKHAPASRVHISIERRGGALRAEVSDDGDGGADPASGSGLRGMERRLAAFDGVLAVSSPAGGPTLVVIEVPVPDYD